MMSVLTIPHDSNKTWLWAFQSLSRDDERSDLLYALNTDTGHGCSNPSVGMMSVLTKPIICRKELACMRSNPSVGVMSVLTRRAIDAALRTVEFQSLSRDDERSDGQPTPHVAAAMAVPIPQSG